MGFMANRWLDETSCLRGECGDQQLRPVKQQELQMATERRRSFAHLAFRWKGKSGPRLCLQDFEKQERRRMRRQQVKPGLIQWDTLCCGSRTPVSLCIGPVGKQGLNGRGMQEHTPHSLTHTHSFSCSSLGSVLLQTHSLLLVLAFFLHYLYSHPLPQTTGRCSLSLPSRRLTSTGQSGQAKPFKHISFPVCCVPSCVSLPHRPTLTDPSSHPHPHGPTFAD